MKLAVVLDTPRTSDPFKVGVPGVYLSRVMAAAAQAAGVSQGLDIQPFYAVTTPRPDRKSPPIADVRAERDRLFTELEAYQPHRVLSVGVAALNALAHDSPKALTISKERGRMRMLGDVPWVPTISHYGVIAHADLHRDLAYDVFKILSQSRPIEPIDIDVLVPTTLDELRFFLSFLDEASVVGVDVETTGLRPVADDLLAVGFGAVTSDGSEGTAVVVNRDLLAVKGVDDVLWDAVWRASRRSVGHNFKFDMQFLAPRIGWAPDEAVIGDTLLLAHLLDERPNRPSSRVRGLGLKDLVAVRYDLAYEIDTDNPDDPDYLGKDVCYTARLWHDLSAEATVESRALMGAHERLLMPVSRAIARCEFGGAPIDVRWVHETIAAYDRRIDRRRGALERALPALVLPETDASAINVLAPIQVANVMYDDWAMTPDVRKHGKLVEGDRSTDKDHVKAAVAKYLGTTHDRQARWLRSLEKLRRDVRQRTTYQKSLIDRVDVDERVRASFLIHGTSTGRLSSRDPNLQNIPAIDREDAIRFRPMRRAFRPLEGRLWAEVDYSQLELRVAAALSGDRGLIDVFASGRDVHREIATSIFSKPPDEITKAERFLAKAVSFGIIYGRGGRALATGAEMRYAEQQLGMRPWTEEQADAFIRKFLRSYPTLHDWMQRLYHDVPRQGYVESPFGRRRRFPLYPKSKGELGAIERQAVNTPVQSAASDICLEAMIEVQRRIEDESDIDARVLFTVHDSICLEVAAHEVGRVERVCRSVMEKDWRGVPLKVDYEVGPTWADVKEVA